MYCLVATDATSWSGSLPNLKVPLGRHLELGRDCFKEIGVVNKKVSRTQLELSVQDGKVSVLLKGTNSSMINDEKLFKEKTYELKIGDVVKLLPDFGFFTLKVNEKVKDASNDSPASSASGASAPQKRKLVEEESKESSSKPPASSQKPESQRLLQLESPSPPPSPRTIEREEKRLEENIRSSQDAFQRSLSASLLEMEFNPKKEQQQKDNLEAIISDVAKLRKVADNAGLCYDDTSPYQCFTVRFSLDTSFLASIQAKQWGIVPKKPVIIQLKFDWNYLDQVDPPSLFTFQSEDPKLNSPTLTDYDTEFGVVQWFLETRIQSVLRKNWFNKPKDPKLVEEEEKKKKASEQKSAEEQVKEFLLKEEEEKKKKQNGEAAEKKDSPLVIELTEEEKKVKVDETKVKNLLAMGFARPDVEKALRKTNNHADNAITVLLGGKIEKPSKADERSSKVTKLVGMGFTEEEAKNALEAFNGDIDAVTANLLDDVINARKKKKTNHSPSRGYYKGKRRYDYDREDEEEYPEEEYNNGEGEEQEDDNFDSLYVKKKDVKPVKKSRLDADPSTMTPEENLWKNGDETSFLVNLYKYINMRFITCPNHCLICDDDLNVNVERLPVCSAESCVKVYQTTAVGHNAISNDIKNNPEVVDLLINLLSCVASGNNVKGWNRGGIGLAGAAANLGADFGRRTTFEPYPWGLGFEKSKTQDLDALLLALDDIPTIDEMKKYPSDETLKVAMDEINPKAFPLLRWIVQSNRTHLSLVHPKKQIPEMKTPLQFQVVHSFPEHERKFQQYIDRAKREKCTNKEKGTYQAFHGSPITNWHSIIRTGLRSGFVPGIYMAGHAAVSLGYMAVGQSNAVGWKNSMWAHNASISAISLLEVADMRHNQRLITGGVVPTGVNVSMQNELVVTRILFFYPQGPKFPTGVSYNVFGVGGRKGNKKGKSPIAEDIDIENNMYYDSDEERKS